MADARPAAIKCRAVTEPIDLNPTKFRIADLASLTGREKQVLLLVADGLSNASIAAELNLSPHTIRSHVSRILTKLGATSRAELGAYAAMIGVINQDETPTAER